MAKWDLGKFDSANEERIAIIKRIRRKAEIMRMEQKAVNSLRYHDSNEILSLLDMLERNLGIKQ